MSKKYYAVLDSKLDYDVTNKVPDPSDVLRYEEYESLYDAKFKCLMWLAEEKARIFENIKKIKLYSECNFKKG